MKQFLLFCTCIFSAFAAFAIENKDTQQQFDVGLSIYHLKYNTGDYSAFLIPNSQEDRLTGTMVGPAAHYTLNIPRLVYVRVGGSWTQGEVSSGSHGCYLHDLNLSAQVGPSFQWQSWNIIPYTGLGYQGYYQHVKQLSVDVASTKFRFKKVYIPLGILVNYDLNANWNVGVAFDWNFDIQSHLTIADLTGTDWSLANKYQTTLRLPLQYTFSHAPRWKVGVTPFWQKNVYGKSKADVGGVALGHPQQTYTSLGAEIKGSFTF